MKKKSIIWSLLLLLLLQIGCKKIIQVDPPVNSFVQQTIFQDDAVATSAVTGIYSRMGAGGYAYGGFNSISSICGLSADELIGYNIGLTEYFTNELKPISDNLNINLYANPYQYILTCNSILEGLSASDELTLEIKKQLQGEAYFIRAFNYFYLVNLFGPVPIQTGTDYRVNRTTKKSSSSEVYGRIIEDLKLAEGLLTDKYVTTERVRPNLSAVHAMLARAYLFIQDWVNAEKYSTLIINKSSIYSLNSLDNSFLKNNTEAIWQLFPSAVTGGNTREGNLFILQATPVYVSLRSDFVANAFEPGDKRKTAWVKSFTNTSGTYYYPFKYKIKSSTTTTEYSMVLRFAEQLLIRAEARAQQNELEGAIDDLDKIRNRAGLPLIKTTNPGIGKSDLIKAVIQERKIEFFSEWGHRWLDLKRLGIAGAVLSPLKTKWDDTDVLYPIPYEETSRNPNITQNPGY